MIKLLCRLYDVTEGEILLNGININNYRYSDYIKMLSVVFQDYKLMAFSILQNIAMDEAETPEVRKKVKELSEMVELDGWIESLEKKEDTNIYKMFDESGVEPSGGQAQKLAIVRALYKNSPMVILDEPTAALDPVAEFEIYQHFDNLVHGNDNDDGFAIGRVVRLRQAEQVRNQDVHLFLHEATPLRYRRCPCHHQCQMLLDTFFERYATILGRVDHLMYHRIDVHAIESSGHSSHRPIIAAQWRQGKAHLLHVRQQPLQGHTLGCAQVKHLGKKYRL